MPILAREPDAYPANLLESAALGSDAGSICWWVLHTLPRREKELMRRLGALQVCFYTPLAERCTRGSTGRVRTSYVPLFPSYVFLYGDEDDRQRAMKTNCAIRWLSVPDQATLTHDLRQIDRLTKSGASLSPVEQFMPGTHVEITQGPLAGLEGTIIRRDKRATLLIEVHFLKRGASVEIEDWMVEPTHSGCGVRA